jgi:hypothetical protein
MFRRYGTNVRAALVHAQLNLDVSINRCINSNIIARGALGNLHGFGRRHSLSLHDDASVRITIKLGNRVNTDGLHLK